MKLKNIFLAILVIFAVIITLFQHFEPSNETWGYWEFAKILANSGKFIIIERSPLYTIYLLFFRPFGYPLNLTVEYIVTSLITIFCLSWFLSKYTFKSLAISASILWLPYMQVSEPPVQKFGLAFFCLSLLARPKSLSYALLILAYLFRPVYIIPVIFYLFFDLKIVLNHVISKKRLATKPKPKTDWPLFIVVLLFLIFSLNQSAHKWNNIFFATTKWFPQNPAKEEIIQNYNWSYIAEKYGTFVGHDFYQTNQEIFGNASNTLEAIRYNPGFVIHTALKFLDESIPMMAKMTIPYYFNFPSLIILGFILFGALYKTKNQSLQIFVLGNLAITFLSIIFLPQYRYLIFSVFPVFIAGAIGWGKIFKNYLARYIATLFLLLLFSPAFMGVNYYNRVYLDWKEVIKNFIYDAKIHDLKILETRSDNYVSSMKESYNTLYPLIKNCRGIMSLEYNFLAAFTDISFDKIYDVWEIPPFGNLGDKAYNGLNPDRVACLLMSRELMLYEGFATNHQIRYQNYIKTYAEYLKSLGAKSYSIPSYGEVIIYSE